MNEDRENIVYVGRQRGLDVKSLPKGVLTLSRSFKPTIDRRPFPLVFYQATISKVEYKKKVRRATVSRRRKK